MPGPSRRRFPRLEPASRAGVLVAVADLPFTFRPTLMPRTTADQALATGLSFSANHALAELTPSRSRAWPG